MEPTHEQVENLKSLLSGDWLLSDPVTRKYYSLWQDDGIVRIPDEETCKAIIEILKLQKDCLALQTRICLITKHRLEVTLVDNTYENYGELFPFPKSAILDQLEALQQAKQKLTQIIADIEAIGFNDIPRLNGYIDKLFDEIK